jgi:hypothetical protein
MTNVTITLDEEVLRRARIRALQQGTSVNRVLGDYLQAYAGASPTRAAVEQALDIARQTHAGSGPGGRTWRREDLHDRTLR